MAKATVKVYLDHLIKRDDLLYKRTVNNSDTSEKPKPYLTIRDLIDATSMAARLRKPDFQRATYAWSPTECVDLLKSVLHDQVVPSVILWRSPNTDIYVLDGGHRISVILAWIKDDWGNQIAVNNGDCAEAAKQVRALLEEQKIGRFEDWQAAAVKFNGLKEKDQVAEIDISPMTPTDIERAQQYNNWWSSEMGFPILWVKGDYEKAEESFLKINKTGRSLSTWETKLVENRQSSFARAVMSVANKSTAMYCWGNRDAKAGKTDSAFAEKISSVISKVEKLHELLFLPAHVVPIESAVQPLLAINELQPETRPNYIAELLTIVAGKKGKKAETEALLAEDKKQSPQAIVNNGINLLDGAIETIGHIYGPSPRSLTLMPLVYFYNMQGRYVRSLLYGMLYWIASGTEEEVRHRKLLFTLHRAAFEDVLIENKDIIIQRIARRIGSGSEVTYPTAKYYNHLLELLISYEGDIKSADFVKDHAHLIHTLGSASDNSPTNSPNKVSTSRTFVGPAKQEIHTKAFIKSFQKCEICGGRFYPGRYMQLDHIDPYAKGGQTKADNGRDTHPFCNNLRNRIEALKAGEETISLPPFVDPSLLPKPKQLTFLALFGDDADANETGE